MKMRQPESKLCSLGTGNHSSPSPPLPALALLLGLMSLISAADAAAQGDGSFFETVDVEVVNVEVFVTDRKGEPITGLTAQDFEIEVDGRKREISNFYAEIGGRAVLPAAPGDEAPRLAAAESDDQRLHLVVFVDNSRLRQPNRKRVFKTLREFFRTRLSDDDLVSVVSLTRSVWVHCDFLSDRRAIEGILDELEESSAKDVFGNLERRRIFSEIFREESGPWEAEELLARIRVHAQNEYDRGLRTIEHLAGFVDTLAGIRGRKALIYVSEGIVNNPGEDLFFSWNDRFGDLNRNYHEEIGNFDLLKQLRELGRQANAGQVTYYPLDAEPDHAGAVRSAGVDGVIPHTSLSIAEESYREPLELIAASTGGRRLQATTTLARQLESYATDFGTYYSLGFAAEGDRERDRRIDVKVKDRKKVVVRHRETFRRRKPDERARDATLAALRFNSLENPLGIGLRAGERREAENDVAILPLTVQIPLGNIVLLPQGEEHAARLSLFVSVKDRGGEMRPVQLIPVSLKVPAGKLEGALTRTAEYELPVILREGDVQVAIGLRDDVATTISTLRLDLGGV